MEAHADDLRDEVDDPDFVRRFKADWRSAPLSTLEIDLLEFAEKLTRAPASITRNDVDRLRADGLTDDAISDAVQVTAYFNYINRVADGLGVDLEEFMPPRNRAE